MMKVFDGARASAQALVMTDDPRARTHSANVLGRWCPEWARRTPRVHACVCERRRATITQENGFSEPPAYLPTK